MIELMLFGPTNLSKETNIVKLLDALEADPKFAPESASSDERRVESYNRQWCIDTSTSPNYKYAGFVHLKRKKVAKYTGYFSYSARPFLHIIFDPKLAKKNYRSLLEWSQSLVDAFTPDYACLEIRYDVERDPWPSELDESLDRLLFASRTVEGSYYKSGPPGIGVYTGLSDHFSSYFEPEYLSKTPNIHIEDQKWGGKHLCLDMEGMPWDADPQDLIDTWQPAINYLSETGLFSELYVEEGKMRRRAGKMRIQPREVEDFETSGSD